MRKRALYAVVGRRSHRHAIQYSRTGTPLLVLALLLAWPATGSGQEFEAAPNVAHSVSVSGGWPHGACCFADGGCTPLPMFACLEVGGLPSPPGTGCDEVACPIWPTGACCLDDGMCKDLAPLPCVAIGGTPRLPGTTCESVDCPPPPGRACCFPDGGCAQLPPMHCLEEGGMPQEPGSTCDGAECGQGSFGACCIDLPNHPNVCMMLPEEVCLAEGGDYVGNGTHCDDPNIPCNAPEPMACCFEGGACWDLPVEACLAEDGMPQGPGSHCDTTECNTPGIGACCIAEGDMQFCLMLPGPHCVAEGGEYFGDGTHCDMPNIPCNGPGPMACCFDDGMCVDLPPMHCMQEGGMPQGPGTTCDMVECGPVEAGACCFDDGSCWELHPMDCMMEGGMPHPPGTTCDMVDCTGGPGIGACCIKWNGVLHCLMLPGDVCLGEGGEYFGDGTVCGDPAIPCAPPEPGACCFANGECAVLPVELCFAKGGEPHAPGTVCSPDICGGPAVGACCIAGPGGGSVCLMVPGPHCAAKGGEYFGDGTHCSDPNIPCNGPGPMACCFDNGKCFDLPPMHCMQEGGMPQGPGSHCDTTECNTPAVGACCIAEGGMQFCLMLPGPHCVAKGGEYFGDGTHCSDPGIPCAPPEAGACCFDDGSCWELHPMDCMMEGGTPHPPGTTCNMVDCTGGPGIGACCIKWNGVLHCLMLPGDVCLGEGGEYFGDGTVCGDPAIPCAPPEPGACCFSNGECAVLPVELCFAKGGEPHEPGTMCSSNICGGPPVGACCIDAPDGSFCLMISGPHCIAEGGQYFGDGTHCDDPSIPCNGPGPMACCFDNGMCWDLPLDVCLAEGGMPQGPDSNCGNVVCGEPSVGACCIEPPNHPAFCLVLPEEVCLAEGGVYFGAGSVCDSSTPCGPPPETMACCFGGGVCVDLPPMLCKQEGGTPQGPGSSCGDAGCDAPLIGACCIDLPGHPNMCLVLPEEVCVAEGGAYMGDGVACEPENPCGTPPETVACCFPDGGCLDLPAPVCQMVGGMPHAPGTFCVNGQCPG